MRPMTCLGLAMAGLLLTGCSKPAAPPEKPKIYAMTPDGNAQYLADNAKKPGVTTLANGMEYRVITAGTGKQATGPHDLVTVSYKGWTVDGRVFTATPAGQSVTFSIGRLITPGWNDALFMMHEGDEWEVALPPELGFGEAGLADAQLPPNSVITFQIKLVAVQPKPK